MVSDIIRSELDAPSNSKEQEMERRLGATRLILVRHGMPDEGNRSDPGDPPLNLQGREQASRLAGRLVKERIDGIVSSPQRRAQETAQPLSDLLGLHVETLDGLAEVDLHTDRYRSPETIRRETPARWEEFLASPAAFFGKDERKFNAAVLGTVARLLAPNALTIAVFSHGTPIKVILQHALGLANRAKFKIGHCSVTRTLGTSLANLVVESMNEDLDPLNRDERP